MQKKQYLSVGVKEKHHTRATLRMKSPIPRVPDLAGTTPRSRQNINPRDVIPPSVPPTPVCY